MKYRWSMAPAQPALARHLAAALSISPLLAQCLINRGQSDPRSAESYLFPRLKNLADPFLLPNLPAALDRLFLARDRGESVVVFGDYDVDGVTSTALLMDVLQAFGWPMRYYLPHRLTEGYGLSQEAAARCLESNPCKLLIAVDCGSTAVAPIQWLRDNGVDVIVLDHHQMTQPPPPAVALVNPWLAAAGKDEEAMAPAYGLELCSAGLAFKLAHAVVKRARQIGLPGAQSYDLRPLLELVALATIADVAPLTGENRILVACGLERLNAPQRLGLRTLKAVAQTPNPVDAYAVGYQLGPRLNAAGRLEDADAALRLLRATDAKEAERLARELDANNRERQAIERAITEQVIGAVRTRFHPDRDFAIVEGQMFWHIGVVGIVASRVLREYYRPTIIVGGDQQEWRGSGRSIAGFDLAAALRDCDDLLVRHGGHAMAAGLTILPERMDALRERLNELVHRSLRPDQLQPRLALDGEIDLGALDLDRVTELRLIGPTGQGNPPLQFAARGIGLQRAPQRLGREQRHAKLWVTDGRTTCEAVFWGVGQAPLPSGTFDLAFTPTINEYNGRRFVQLKVLDWQNH